MRRGLAASAQFWRGVIAETGLFAGVLVAAAFLTSFAPPAQANGAAFDETKHTSGIRIELLTATTLPGRNRFVVRVQQGLSPITGAEKVALRFTMVEHDMGEQELVATERAPGEYVAEGSPTAMLGPWKVQVIVRLAGRPDIAANPRYAGRERLRLADEIRGLFAEAVRDRVAEELFHEGEAWRVPFGLVPSMAENVALRVSVAMGFLNSKVDQRVG